MTETRGKREVLVLKSASGTGRSIAYNVDRERLAAVWRDKGLEEPSSLIEAVVELMANQDFLDATRLTLSGSIKRQTGRLHEVKEIEKTARDLKAKILNLKKSDLGRRHFESWMRPYFGRFSGFESHYPEAIFMEFLTTFSNIIEQNYMPAPNKEHWHGFIKKVGDLFRDFGEKILQTSDQPFVNILVEIDSQFPGLVFPPNTIPQARHSYVLRALGRKK